MRNDLVVSVCCITYNHENYIRDAIEGFLLQKTTFPIEIIIYDDASIDGNTAVIKEYAVKYPKLIIPIFQKENQYSKGVRGILMKFLSPKAKGKYIAFCEGDDYWTDPYKLQKQIDFLENNSDYAICFHNARILNQKTGNSSKLFFYGKQKKSFELKDILRDNFIPTLTCVFRNHLFEKLPTWYKSAFPGDWPLHIINAHYGKIGYIDEVMATYRNHGKGIVTGSNPLHNYQRYIKTFENIRSYVSPKLKSIANETISRFYFELSWLYYKENNINKAYNSFIKCLKIKPFNSKISKKRLLIFVGKLFLNKISS